MRAKVAGDSNTPVEDPTWEATAKVCLAEKKKQQTKQNKTKKTTFYFCRVSKRSPPSPSHINLRLNIQFVECKINNILRKRRLVELF